MRTITKEQGKSFKLFVKTDNERFGAICRNAPDINERHITATKAHERWMYWLKMEQRYWALTYELNKEGS
jgi:hypothetical protein